MIERATVSPPTPESKMPIGANRSVTTPSPAPGRPFGATGPPAPDQTASRRPARRRSHRTGGPAGWFTLHNSPEHGNHAQQRTAVDEHHHQRDDNLPEMAGEPAEHQKKGQPAEDQPGGADVVGRQCAATEAADKPGAQATENPDDRCRPHEPRHTGQRHQESEHQGRHGIGQQVAPVGVQQRSEQDALESVGLQRPDAVAVSACPES